MNHPPTPEARSTSRCATLPSDTRFCAWRVVCSLLRRQRHVAICRCIPGRTSTTSAGSPSSWRWRCPMSRSSPRTRRAASGASSRDQHRRPLGPRQAGRDGVSLTPPHAPARRGGPRAAVRDALELRRQFLRARARRTDHAAGISRTSELLARPAPIHRGAPFGGPRDRSRSAKVPAAAPRDAARPGEPTGRRSVPSSVPPSHRRVPDTLRQPDRTRFPADTIGP